MRIIIKSANKNLLSILNKNPDTDYGLYLKPLKNGHLIGNCVSENEYEIVFQDTKHSYTQYSDNQIDFKSFCSPVVIMDMMSNLFGDLLKTTEDVEKTTIGWLENKTIKEIDTPNLCTIEVSNMIIDSGWYRDRKFLLSKYLPRISCTPVDGQTGLFNVSVESASIVEAINLITLVGFMCAVSNDRDFYIHSDQIKKYATVLTNVNPPYFCWYLFIKRCVIRSEKLGDELLPYLEDKFKTGNGMDVFFTRFDTHTDRLNWCKENLEVDIPLLDFGCGEFRLERKIQKQFKAPIRSHDVEDYSDLHNTFKPRYPHLDWKFSTDLISLLDQESFNMCATEVGEHLEWNLFAKEMQDICKTDKIRKLLITTPNQNFNKYYGLDDTEVRRYDHVEELTSDGFKEWCNDTFKKIAKSIEFHKIGDCIDGECVTSGAIVTLND